MFPQRPASSSGEGGGRVRGRPGSTPSHRRRGASARHLVGRGSDGASPRCLCVEGDCSCRRDAIVSQLRMALEDEVAGVLIGRAGANINALRQVVVARALYAEIAKS